MVEGEGSVEFTTPERTRLRHRLGVPARKMLGA